MPLDFNDALIFDDNNSPYRTERLPQYDIADLKRRLAERAREWVPRLFPRGRISADRKELRLADITGAPPKKEGSCVIHLAGDHAGEWYDFSTDGKGDALDTLSRGSRIPFGHRLFERAAEIVGAAAQSARTTAGETIDGYADGSGSGDAAKANTEKAEKIWEEGQAAAGTIVETYLGSRGLPLPDSEDLRCHPGQYFTFPGGGAMLLPCMVARLRDFATGEPTGGVHRTYLSPEGNKLPVEKPKKMLGPCQGGGILVGEVDGDLIVGEGIETTYSAAIIFYQAQVAWWSLLSTSGFTALAQVIASGIAGTKLEKLRRLIIAADRGKGGEDAARRLHEAATKAGINALIVRPRSTDDFNVDLRRNKWTAEEAEAALAKPDTEDAKPDTEDAEQETPQQKKRNGVEVIRFGDMQPRVEDRSIAGDILLADEVSGLIGSSGSGKTFLAIDLSLRIAGGWDWFGKPTRKTGVVYIAAEAGRGIVNRVCAFKIANPDLPPDLPFAAIVSPVNLREQHGPADTDAVLAAIRNAGIGLPGLIVVDTLNRAMAGGDENSSNDMGAIIANIDRLRGIGAHVMIVHHLGKDASRGARGHSSLHAALDTEIIVTRDNGSGISAAQVTKQRELPIGGRFAYALRSVEIGRDQNGKPVTSCVVEPAEDVGSDRPGKTLSAAARRALDLLVDAIARGGEVPPPDTHIPPKKGCVREAVWRECCYRGQVAESDKPDAKQKAFKRAAELLVARGLVGKWGDWVWPV